MVELIEIGFMVSQTLQSGSIIGHRVSIVGSSQSGSSSQCSAVQAIVREQVEA
jgi:hypothetical protein